MLNDVDGPRAGWGGPVDRAVRDGNGYKLAVGSVDGAYGDGG